MKHLALAAILCVASTTSVLAWWDNVVDTVETRWANGQLKEQYVQITYGGNEKTQKTGLYRSWHSNGQIQKEGYYNCDAKMNTWIRWDSAGTRIEEITYVNGKKHGREIEWYPDQMVKKLLRYRNGNLHGKCIWYVPGYSWNTLINNPPIPIEAERFYVDGTLLVTIKEDGHSKQPCGVPEPYYSAEHDLWIEWNNGCSDFYVGRQVEGRKQGKWVLWMSHGEKQRVDFYQNGELLEF